MCGVAGGMFSVLLGVLRWAGEVVVGVALGVVVRFLDGLPVTTKADRDYHGYGMRSMRYITEKYGGTLTAQYRDGLFVLNLLFPER